MPENNAARAKPAPNPHSVVHRAILPPEHATLRLRPTQSGWPTAAAMAVIAALLAFHVWTWTAHPTAADARVAVSRETVR